MTCSLFTRRRRSIRFPETLLAALVALTMAGAPAVTEAGGPVVSTGVPIQFTDQSTHGPTTWVWDFDYDGANVVVRSTAQDPIWTFDEVRTYQVYLEVCNASGCNEAVKSVEVQGSVAPELIFESSFETGDLLDWSSTNP